MSPQAVHKQGGIDDDGDDDEDDDYETKKKREVEEGCVLWL